MHLHTHEIIVFSGFLVFIILMLSLDLGVFNRRSHALSFREALTWTIVWIGISFGFYLLLRFFGAQLHNITDIEGIKASVLQYHHPIKIDGLDFAEAIKIYNINLSLEFLTGYLIEYSLSVDNIFVIIMIFLSFNIPQKYYHRVLFWGILGAIVMRFLFIFLASAMIQRFEWILLIFGGMLIFLGGKMGYEFFAGKNDEKIDTVHHPVVKFISRLFLVTRKETGKRFWIRENGKFYITPLLIVLVIIEFSDVLFAVDSVPAVFSVTLDPFIVFFSNIFAILGLRSLFFLVMDVMNRFHFLKLGLAFLLTFVGVKMLLSLHISTIATLSIILGILLFFALLSLLFPVRKKREHVPEKLKQPSKESK
jgi:tellurite resistance protein TerC